MTEAVEKSNKNKLKRMVLISTESACEVSSNLLKTCPHPHYIKAILCHFFMILKEKQFENKC